MGYIPYNSQKYETREKEKEKEKEEEKVFMEKKLQ